MQFFQPIHSCSYPPEKRIDIKAKSKKKIVEKSKTDRQKDGFLRSQNRTRDLSITSIAITVERDKPTTPSGDVSENPSVNRGLDLRFE
jgi:hypothetical protein